jgi:hypothetical protein
MVREGKLIEADEVTQQIESLVDLEYNELRNDLMT